jgi:hypothetical protein
MRFIAGIIGVTLMCSTTAFGQQATIGNPKDTVTQQQNRGSPQPVMPNGTAKGIGGDMGQVLGMKPLTNAGGATQGVGLNTPGYGNRVNGYGQGAAGYKGINCSPTAYPRSPFCPPDTTQAR